MRHKSSLHIRWADLDAFGHINNAVYLVYVQEARADFTWYARKARGEQPILADMVVARAEIDFIEPIYEGGINVDVEIYVTRIGSASFDLAYEISHDGVIKSKAVTVQVAVSMETKKSRPLNEMEREFLSQYLDPLSEAK